MKNLKTLRKINFSKLIKISDTPHSISLGFSIGVFVSFTPLIGIHIIIALVISWMIRANYFSAIIGTFIGTPFTYPFIWFASIYVGNFFIPIKYNWINSKVGKGSAIFIHLTKNYKPTAGCIGLSEKDFLILIKIIKKNTTIKII